MQAPINVFDAGWYTGSVRPGQKGASIIVGHVSGPTRHGIFEKLSQLKNGDSITIGNGAGNVFNFGNNALAASRAHAANPESPLKGLEIGRAHV